ncbi:2'-5' RNA ligase family protein [Leucobacter tardus]|uniref:2'-5' RNA ligase family protein n=1 Tax=Leucobacter tardus TaxID=501483 RepID=UPI0027DBCF92|nr:2'-5' RNA ligase family protein [Leucobacter tardus]
MISVELLLDDDTERRVHDEWRRLADAGLSSQGANRSPSNRPHVTLLVRSQVGPVSFTEAVQLLPIPLELGEPIVFRHGERGVLARPVRVTEALRDLHAAVHRAAGPGDDAPFTAAGEWTPHVTLARRLRLDALDDALTLVGRACSGAGVALRRWDSETRTVTPL